MPVNNHAQPPVDYGALGVRRIDVLGRARSRLQGLGGDVM
jgi:hypothetical protein